MLAAGFTIAASFLAWYRKLTKNIWLHTCAQAHMHAHVLTEQRYISVAGTTMNVFDQGLGSTRLYYSNGICTHDYSPPCGGAQSPILKEADCSFGLYQVPKLTHHFNVLHAHRTASGNHRKVCWILVLCRVMITKPNRVS